MRLFLLFATALAAVCLVDTTVRAGAVGWYAAPALNGERLVFASEGDLWTATVPMDQPAATEITASRLTTGDGEESAPCISPDGRWLAFAAEVDGNVDVFVMPIDGGETHRLTFHPGRDQPLCFAPDGESIYFRSSRRHPLARQELWQVSRGGGMPRQVAIGDCSLAAVSATGRQVVFNRWSNESWNWRGYRGGTAPDLWIADLDTGEFSPLAADAANDLFPMWTMGRVYFVSDRSGNTNIHSLRPDGGDLRMHTSFPSVTGLDPTDIEGFTIRAASADTRRGGSRIVMAQGGQIALLDLRDDSVHRLPVVLASDRRGRRTVWIDPREMVTEIAVSTDGAIAVLGTRGELAAIPIGPDPSAALPAPIQLSRTTGAREWGATVFTDPTGTARVAFITDAGGEQQIGTVALDGSESPSLLTVDRDTWLLPPQVSPNGEWIAFGDSRHRLHLLNSVTLEKRLIDTSEAWEIVDYRFSPDSQWLAYTLPMANGMRTVRLYSLRTERSIAVSSGLFDDSLPRWDPAGKYLYIVSRRHFDPLMGPMDFEHALVNMGEIYVLPLRTVTPPPDMIEASRAGFDLRAWARGTEATDEQTDKARGAAEARGDGGDAAAPGGVDPARNAVEGDAAGDRVKGADDAGDAPAAGVVPPTVDPIAIDSDNLPDRLFRLPIEPGELSDLEAVRGGCCTCVARRGG